jgi:c-di-GMP-binding flagellar brake protein YcgR
MDEKLDQILLLLSKGEAQKEPFEEGVGVNISGSGMNLIVDKQFEPGQVIRAKFFLTKAPFLFMEVFGEVVRSIRLEEKGEKNYQLGIEFLDLNGHDRDRIITAVFQRQTIRKNKSTDLDPI